MSEAKKKNYFWILSKKTIGTFASSKKSSTFASHLRNKRTSKEVWRDGRVVECTGLENRRTARYRGFESLSLRHEIGRLAQLVQSICLTSRGSAVRIRQRPQRHPFGCLFLYILVHTEK